MNISEQVPFLKLEPYEIAIDIPWRGREAGKRGIVGILAKPVDLSSNKLSISCHGYAGHKNYTYMKLLGQKMARELDIWTFRFDFLGSGDSGDVDDPEKGAVLRDEVEQVRTVANFFRNSSAHSRATGSAHDFTIDSLVGHSKGGSTVLAFVAYEARKWLKNDPEAIIPPKIAVCSPRLTGKDVLASTSKSVVEVGGKKVVRNLVYRHGKFGVPVQTSYDELLDIATMEASTDRNFFTSLKHLKGVCSVRLIYSTRDTVVEISDSYRFAKSLGDICELVFIKHADHNYYGVVKITPENAAMMNPENRPVNRRGIINYNPEVAQLIVDWFKTKGTTRKLLAAPKATNSDIYRPVWRIVDGIENLREIGCYAVSEFSHLDYGHSTGFKLVPEGPLDNVFVVKPNFAFRSANSTTLTSVGLKGLSVRLGVTKVFDLRSESELNSTPKFPIDNAYNIEYVHNPMFAHENLSPEMIFMRYQNLLTSKSSIASAYMDFVANGSNCIATIFDHVLAQPQQGFLFHCAVGKDRTGVVAALLLLAAGADKESIAKDYSYTNEGIKPLRASVWAQFVPSVEKYLRKFVIYKGLPESTSHEEILAYVNKYLSGGQPGWDIYKEGFDNLLSAPYDSMILFLEKFHEKYVDVYKYLEAELGYSAQEVYIIKRNLIAERETKSKI